MNEAQLFLDSKYDLVLIHSVLEGMSGRMLVDSVVNPRVVRLDTAAITMFGGNPDLEAAIELIHYSSIYYVTPENKKWENRLKSEFGNRIETLILTAYKPDTLDRNELREIIRNIPDGYQVKRLDAALCSQLLQDISNDCFFENFASVIEFLQRGIGFCILHKNRIVSAATSMASLSNAIDIEIETADEHRNKGLATVTGAMIVLHCIQNQIEPKWLAANAYTEKLAERLGYIKGEIYETNEIDELN